MRRLETEMIDFDHVQRVDPKTSDEDVMTALAALLQQRVATRCVVEFVP